MSTRAAFLFFSAVAIGTVVILGDISEPDVAEAGVLIRGTVSPNIRPSRARFYRVRSTSSVLRATNPTLAPRETARDEIRQQLRDEQRYYRKLVQWHRKRVQYDRKVAQLRRKAEAKERKAAEKRRRAYARKLRNQGQPDSGQPASDSVAIDPREWFTKKIARKNPFATEPTAPPAAKPGIKSEKDPATEKSSASDSNFLVNDDQRGREIKGTDPKRNKGSGFWFHMKRAIGAA